jgi:hypothetical protein
VARFQIKYATPLLKVPVTFFQFAVTLVGRGFDSSVSRRTSPEYQESKYFPQRNISARNTFEVFCME